MSSLTPADFTEDEARAIVSRLRSAVSDIAILNGTLSDSNVALNRIVHLDSANQKVQESAIDDVVAILEALRDQLDIDEPANAPHEIVYNSNFPNEPNPTPPNAYATPELNDTLLDWTMQETVGFDLVDMNPQPVPGDPAYATLTTEFLERLTERLHPTMGSFKLKAMMASSVGADASKAAIITQRTAFWTDLGFTTEDE